MRRTNRLHSVDLVHHLFLYVVVCLPLCQRNAQTLIKHSHINNSQSCITLRDVSHVQTRCAFCFDKLTPCCFPVKLCEFMTFLIKKRIVTGSCLITSGVGVTPQSVSWGRGLPARGTSNGLKAAFIYFITSNKQCFRHMT